MFSVHATPEELRNSTIISYFGFVFEENSGTVITFPGVSNGPIKLKSASQNLAFTRIARKKIDVCLLARAHKKIFPLLACSDSR